MALRGSNTRVKLYTIIKPTGETHTELVAYGSYKEMTKKVKQLHHNYPECKIVSEQNLGGWLK